MISKDDIRQLVEEKIAGTEYSLKEVKLSSSKIIVIVDRLGGINLSDCVDISRFVQSRLDEETLSTHELEVTSPGINEAEAMATLKKSKK